MRDDGYTTPEGFTLYRPLLLPEARAFADVLTYVREWDHATMTGRAGRVPQPDLVPLARSIHGNAVGPFCTVSTLAGGVGPALTRRSIAVVATDAALSAIRPRIVTNDDRLSFKVIEHEGTGRALVIAEHGYIIGSHWLAYIDPATIPAPAVVSA